MILPLRKEQRRSLTWMMSREKQGEDAAVFVEEEISEATLGPLAWRAEGKAYRSITRAGGILADDVGFGKVRPFSSGSPPPSAR